MIKKIKEENYDLAIELIKESYFATESKNDSLKGQVEFIIEITNKVDFINNLEMYGYFDNNQLLGIISITKDYYIKHLFIKPNHLNQHIGSTLLDYIIEIARNNNIKVITLDSSIYGYPFYLKKGFVKSDNTVTINGMSYIPMNKKIVDD